MVVGTKHNTRMQQCVIQVLELCQIDGQLTDAPDTSYTVFERLKELLEWETPKVRASIMAAMTQLYNAYNLRCRMCSKLAEWAKGDGRLSEYRGYSSSYQASISAIIMHEGMKVRIGLIREKIHCLRVWRSRERRIKGGGYDVMDEFVKRTHIAAYLFEGSGLQGRMYARFANAHGRICAVRNMAAYLGRNRETPQGS